MLQKEFVPKELAIKLRDLDFNEPCLFVYRMESLYTPIVSNFLDNLKEEIECYRNTKMVNWVSAPSYSQAFRWFREVHGLVVEITTGGRPKEYYVFVDGYIYDEYDTNNQKSFSYDDAQEAALKRLIELVEERQKQPKPVPVEKTLHTLSIYATINEKLQEEGYEPITFQRAVELGLNEKTQESDVESFVEYFYTKEDQEMNNKDETLPC
jgi:ribosomal protein S10